LAAACMVLFPRAAHAARAQSWSADPSFGGAALDVVKHFAEPFYGAATNGISGGIRVALGVGRPLVVSVFVTNANLQETSPTDAIRSRQVLRSEGARRIQTDSVAEDL